MTAPHADAPPGGIAQRTTKDLAKAAEGGRVAVDRDPESDARREPAGGIAPVDRVRQQHGIGGHEPVGGFEGVDERHGERRRVIERRGQHGGGAEGTGIRRERRLRVRRRDDQRDRGADGGRRGEQAGGALLEPARRGRLEHHQDGIMCEVHRRPLTPAGSAPGRPPTARRRRPRP